MSAPVDYRANEASAAVLAEHLRRCDAAFVPSLSGRVDISAYARKLAARAERFEAWSGGTLVGLVAVYPGDSAQPRAFVTNVSVLPQWQRQGIAGRLMTACVAQAAAQGCRCVELEVDRANRSAMALYGRLGFAPMAGAGVSAVMRLDIERKTQ